MLNAILLTAVALGVTVQNLARKSYNAKAEGGALTFCAASCAFALAVFLINSGGSFDFSYEIIPYSVIFAISYSAATLAMLPAIRHGSLSLTSLIIQYSLIIPTLFGFIFWNEDIRIGGIIGIILLLISLALINFEGKTEKKTVTPRWLLFVSLAFLGNGACSTVQKAQQNAHSGMYKNEFMIISLIISFAVMTVAALICERGGMKHNLKVGFVRYGICGIANGLVNFLVLILSGRMAASVMFPIISAGGIVSAYIAAKVIYREKMSALQTVGLAVGIVSIIALNL